MAVDHRWWEWCSHFQGEMATIMNNNNNLNGYDYFIFSKACRSLITNTLQQSTWTWTENIFFITYMQFWWYKRRLCPGFAQNTCMFHSKADLFYLGPEANFERKVLIFPVTQPQARGPVFAPHVQVSARVDGGIRTQPTLDRRDHDVWIELVASEEGCRQEGGFHCLVQVWAFTQYTVAPDKYIVIFWGKKISYKK